MEVKTASSPGAAKAPLEAVLDLRSVSVSYGSTRILHGLDLSVGRGELLALLGPSGSGKTTIIRAIAGFTEPSEGSITLHGRELIGQPIHRRNIGIVFQSYALFPHMSVRDNIAYALRVRKWSSAKVRARVDELIELVRLQGHGDKRPAKLSGGQQQRVALARALAMDPELLLLDEPLSNLDANLRRDVGEEIRRLQQRTGTTTIMVTHDRQEAFSMADRIAVLQDGRIRQLDTPLEIYRRPNSPFMAEFVGAANLLPIVGSTNGTLEKEPHHTVHDQVASGAASHTSTVITPLGPLTTTHSVADAGHVLIRPEDVRIVEPGSGLDALIVSSFYYGATLQVELEVAGTTLHASPAGTLASRLQAGLTVGIEIDPSDVILIPRNP